MQATQSAAALGRHGPQIPDDFRVQRLPQLLPEAGAVPRPRPAHESDGAHDGRAARARPPPAQAHQPRSRAAARAPEHPVAAAAGRQRPDAQHVGDDVQHVRRRCQAQEGRQSQGPRELQKEIETFSMRASFFCLFFCLSFARNTQSSANILSIYVYVC